MSTDLTVLLTYVEQQPGVVVLVGLFLITVSLVSLAFLSKTHN